MSWANVDSISAVKVWLSDSPQSDSATIFSNERHQSAVSIGVSFSYLGDCVDKPSEDEVRSAIRLIDNTTGGSLAHLLEGPKGEYANWYSASPYMNVKTPDESNYDFEFTYYLSALSSEEASEGVAVVLSFVNGDDVLIEYDTSSHGDGDVKTYTTINMVPAKRYGVKDSGFTEINMTADAGTPEFKVYQEFLKNSSQNYGISRMKIASDYFYFKDIADDYNSDLRQPNYIYFNSDSLQLNNTYCLTSSEEYSKSNYVYSNALSNGTNDADIPAFYFTGEVNQTSDEVVFLNISAKIESMVASDYRSISMNFTAHDQFGNLITIYVVFNGAALISNVGY